jgi:D-3-phosphoglycerate dehydrogenase
MSTKVLIGPSSFGQADPAPMARLRDAGVEVIDNPHKRKLTQDELFTLLTSEVTGIVAGLEPLNREVLSHSKLKVVSRVGSGLSNVDLHAAKDLGIAVRTTPDAPVQAVAELTLGALLGLLRHIPQMDRALNAGQWKKIIGRQLSDMTVAVIGYGRIGRRVGELIAAVGANVLAVDPQLSAPPTDVQLVDLPTALSSADVLTLHCAGEEQLLGVKEFNAMKPGAYLLNAARGGLIDEAALISALDDKHLAGAWIDTYSQEPYNGPLCGRSDVVLTPHVGTYAKECRLRMEMEAVDNLLAVLQA